MSETFHLSTEAAEAYETRFVPALFADWAPHVVGAAGVTPGQEVLDVACGTGIVARYAHMLMGGRGRVVGVDRNAVTLSVARRVEPVIEWRLGDATDLPLPDESFDVALCQAGLMFVVDRDRAVSELARVLRPGGTVCLHAWSGLDEQPAYRLLLEIAARHAGPAARSVLDSYWVLGDPVDVRRSVVAAGLEVVDTVIRLGTAHFDSIDDFVETEIGATPLIGRLSAAQSERILDDARTALSRYTTPDGRAEIPLSGYLVVARRP